MTTDAPDSDPIEQLGARIDKARSQAADAGVLVDPDEKRYADSGTNPAADDQTIAPPG